MERVQKILASAGVASRRKCEELIKAGRVKVNDKVIGLGDKADAEKEVILLDGRRISFPQKRYFLLYKPYGYVTTTQDRFAKKKVTDLVNAGERLFPVGRLDKDAEGLIILTNDGEFANRIMHPRYEIEKTYLVRLDKDINSRDVAEISKGVFIDGRMVSCRIKVLDKKEVEITLHEGRHKIVKRIFKKKGYYVKRLIRTRIGDFTLGNLKPGGYIELVGERVKSIL